MNIKHKAALITVAGFLGVFATLYAITSYPVLLGLIFIGAAVFLVYKAVLNYLEHNERFKSQ